MADHTFIFTNYRRQDQLLDIIRNTRALVPAAIIKVWDNSCGLSFPKEACDELVQSTANFSTSPRWWLASVAETPFVTVMDDDLMFTREDLVRRCVEGLSPGFDGIGLYGVKLEGRPYEACPQVQGMRRPVDIIKGRFFMVRTSAIRDLPPVKPGAEDDIIVSAYLRGRCVIVESKRDEVVTLTEDFALRHRPDHMKRRNMTAKECFAEQYLTGGAAIH